MSTRTRTEPLLASLASWLVLTASFGLSFSTWVALADLAGFRGSVHLVWPVELTLSQAWLLPVAADGFVTVALVVWLAPKVRADVAEFARKNTYLAAGIGIVTQSAYHGLMVWSESGELWRAALALVVGAIAPLLAALAVHMRALFRASTATTEPVSTNVDTGPAVSPIGDVAPVLEVVPPVGDVEAPAPVHPVPVRRRRGTAAQQLADRVQVLSRAS